MYYAKNLGCNCMMTGLSGWSRSRYWSYPQWSGSFIQNRNIDPVVVMDDLPGMDDPTGGEYWASTGAWGPTQYAGRFTPHGFGFF
jgi:hypothetical protein